MKNKLSFGLFTIIMLGGFYLQGQYKTEPLAPDISRGVFAPTIIKHSFEYHNYIQFPKGVVHDPKCPNFIHEANKVEHQ